LARSIYAAHCERFTNALPRALRFESPQLRQEALAKLQVFSTVKIL
jgi:hypothetical protein